MSAHTDVLGDLLGLSSVGSNTTLGHADAVLKRELAERVDACLWGVAAYRLEQGGGAVFVNRQPSSLLDSGALQRRRLARVSTRAQWQQTKSAKRLSQLSVPLVGGRTVAARKALAIGRLQRAMLYMVSRGETRKQQ